MKKHIHTCNGIEIPEIVKRLFYHEAVEDEIKQSDYIDLLCKMIDYKAADTALEAKIMPIEFTYVPSTLEIFKESCTKILAHESGLYPGVRYVYRDETEEKFYGIYTLISLDDVPEFFAIIYYLKEGGLYTYIPNLNNWNFVEKVDETDQPAINEILVYLLTGIKE
jgi:hypothetical protein